MASSKAETVAEYLKELDPERRKAISTVRKLIKDNLPKGYTESMNFGMITYEVPLTRYPDTYNKQPLGYLALASQKNYMTLYLMSVYQGGDAAFRRDYEKTGKKLDMGKSCLHFKQIGDLPLDFLARTIASTPPEALIEQYEKVRSGRR